MEINMDSHHAGDGKKRCIMAWNNEKDVILMREMMVNEIFLHKVGSRERGNVWQHIATTLNLLDGFAVTGRSVRDHFTSISRKYTVQNNKDERTTGEGGDPPSEFDMLMEELIALSRESDEKNNTEAERQKASDKLEKEKAISIRNTAMERIGQTQKRESDSSESDTSFEKKQRRSAGDTLEFLREKMAVDQEMKRAERELREKQNEQFTTLLQTFQSTMHRQQEQSNQMQQQMLLLMQQQQQQLQYFIQKEQK